jgi:50S ribosomal protein L16 3-hydroxylase
MPVAKFLRRYWQKRPLLVRSAIAGFVDPLTPDELAGLACEHGVESRLVRGAGKRFRVEWGPHSERRFSMLGRRNWTLLVQEVNRYVPEAALLLDRFAFVPNVRVDDVMVSFAARGGSVGAHLDSYDVFLVQGLGRRRWRFHRKKTRSTRFVPNQPLRILERFSPHVDVVLEKGDMLYIPPGFAHHGIAETACLTYSIGFRALGEGEARAAFAGSRATTELLRDPPLAPAKNPGAIPPALLRRVRDAVRTLSASNEEIDRWFASYATRLKPGHAMEPARVPRIGKTSIVLRSEEGRFAFLPRARGLYLYVGGEEIEVSAKDADVARLVCAKRRFEGKELLRAPALVRRLFAMGALSVTRV